MLVLISTAAAAAAAVVAATATAATATATKKIQVPQEKKNINKVWLDNDDANKVEIHKKLQKTIYIATVMLGVYHCVYSTDISHTHTHTHTHTHIYIVVNRKE